MVLVVLPVKVKKRRVNICRQKFLAIDPIYYAVYAIMTKRGDFGLINFYNLNILNMNNI